jgi:hypothetical protein
MTFNSIMSILKSLDWANETSFILQNTLYLVKPVL